MLALTFTRYHILTNLQRIFNTHFKKCRLLFSAVISEHFSKNRVIISVVATKIWYFKKCAVFIGPPCTLSNNYHKYLYVQGRRVAGLEVVLVPSHSEETSQQSQPSFNKQ